MAEQECLWYNGEFGHYELLDFDPDGYTLKEVEHIAKGILFDKYGFNEEEMQKALQTLYLIDIENLVDVVK